MAKRKINKKVLDNFEDITIKDDINEAEKEVGGDQAEETQTEPAAKDIFFPASVKSYVEIHPGKEVAACVVSAPIQKSNPKANNAIRGVFSLGKKMGKV